MSYKIYIRKQAQNDLNKISPEEFNKITDIINNLKDYSRPRGVKKLAQHNLWRMRVGAFRIIYSIDDSAGIIVVLRILRRNEQTYKHLS